MATTYQADRMITGVVPVMNAVADITVVAVYPLTAAFVINDLVQMMTLPLGVFVTSVWISSDTALDTNGSSLLAYDVGDSNLATRYISNKAQGNNIALPPYHTDQSASMGYKTGTNDGDTIVVVKVHTAPATGAITGNLRLAVTYSRQSRIDLAA